ncbi:MAG: phosphoglucosamine mutase [FCB group bacterium]|nr:phosphoglucosamine mutase [FCB group bacterium]
MKLIRGISGIRGIVGQTLTAETAGIYAGAFQTLQPAGAIVVARDNRYHGPAIMEAVMQSLVKAGRRVIDCGMVPTPTAQFLVEKNGYAGGIVITASHNPIEYNGMKFIDADGCFLNAARNQELFELVDGDSSQIEHSTGAIESYPGCLHQHIEHTLQLSAIDAERIKSRKFRVAVDAVNGAGSFAIPGLLQALACEVIPVHCTPDGYFPRLPEPLPDNLSVLGAAVREYRADIGLALDPDGDRLALLDEQGRPLGEEFSITFAADGFLYQTGLKKPIVTNLSTTQALDVVAARHGVSVLRSAIGEINVVNLMKASDSVFGGEGNGGIILPESHYGRDALVGTVLVLQRLALSLKPLSDIVADFPRFFMKKEKIQLGNLDPDQVILDLSEVFTDIEQNMVDGLKLIWKDRWAHIRKSNTEPIIRIYIEAPSEKEAVDIFELVRNHI